MAYIGNELEIFEKAYHWKAYYASFIRPYIYSTVLEVGAGLAGTTTFLCHGQQKEWICLEPDVELIERVYNKIHAREIPECCRAMAGTIIDLPSKKLFETIIYIDVIEHIENDRQELKIAAKHLFAGGILIVLAPAYQNLYSPFDKSIGHHRRYTKKSLSAIVPQQLHLEKMLYLDSVGLFASMMNKIVLRQNYPTEKQIKFWDNTIIPASKIVDKLSMFHFGKTVLGIWRNC